MGRKLPLPGEDLRTKAASGATAHLEATILECNETHDRIVEPEVQGHVEQGDLLADRDIDVR
jgi:hypothetical protein